MEAVIPYYTYAGALWYVCDIMFGNYDRRAYSAGSASQANYLLFLFVVSSFTMLIHLMNMLIAIMGDSFARRTEVAQEIMTQNHLKFVIDNYHLIKLAFKDIREVKYIVTAFYSQQVADADEDKIMNEDVNQLKDGVQKLTRIVMSQKGKIYE